MSSPILVLDANIMIRAVLGNKVRDYLIKHNEAVDFFAPDVCVEDAERYLPLIFEKRGISATIALQVFSHVKTLLQIVDHSIYQEYSRDAQQRIKNRDLRDWEPVATALLFNCPIWTEDKDFFGVGIPTWTTDRIHVFFNSLTANILQPEPEF